MVEKSKYTEDEIDDWIAKDAITELSEAIENDISIINYRDMFGQTYLYTAAKLEKLDVCKLFIQNGMDINTLDSRKGKITPLEYACRTGNVELVRFFLDSGADPNPGRTSFRTINCRKPTAAKIIELMIEHGLDVNQVFLMFDDPNKRRTALDFAGSNSEITAVLKKHGAKRAAELE